MIGFVNVNKVSYYNVVTNAQGDVIKLLGGSGAVRATYTYDALGNATVTTTNTLSQTIANANSIRYRGYVYDSETNLYYLQSRYYDPQTGRFINCDSGEYIGIINYFTGWNGFNYCFNNPISFSDITGHLGWPGEIHNAVVDRIAYRLKMDKNKKINYYSGGYGFADLIDLKHRYIWEVKRNTVKKSKAITQLTKYCNGYYKNKKGKIISGFKKGTYIRHEMFMHENTATLYYVWYWYVGDGIIYYDYTKDSKLVPTDDELSAIVFAVSALFSLIGFLCGIPSGGFAYA